jgi:glycosyltransferase involved in cell wall biosynthesis
VKRVQVQEAGEESRHPADYESGPGVHDGYTTNIGQSGRLLRRTLRILHVTPYAPDAWAYGGIPRLVGALARGLARRGHDITVCTTDACDRSSRLTGPRSYTSAEGVHWRVFRNVSNALAYHLQLFLPLDLDQYLSKHVQRFDVAHLHACRNIPGAIAARHLRKRHVPYLLAPNGTAPLIERRRLAKHLFDFVAGHRVLAGAARVLAVSQEEQRQLQALGVPPAAVRVVPNPLDLDEFRSPVPRGRFRARLGIGAGPLVLFLGKLTPRKRVDLLIRAFAQLRRPDLSLVIAGNDMGAGREARALADGLGLARQATFTGLLKGEHRLQALADADVVVYPCEHEIFGLVPLEALLLGTPVIVADDSGCGEIIRSTGGGQIVQAGDVGGVAHAILAVVSDLEHWRSAAAEAAKRVRAAYGEDVVCSAIEELYHEMVPA